MISIARALAVTPVPSEPLNNPALGWHNLVTAENVSADSELDDYPASNLANPATDGRHLWKSDSLETQYLTVTIGGIVTIDYLAVARHNFGTARTTVSVEALIDAEWTEVHQPIMPGDDGPLMLRLAAQSTNGIRLKIVPDDDEDTPKPEAAVLYTGKLLVFQRGVRGPFTPLTYGRRREVTNGRSESGNFLGRIQTGGSRQSVAGFDNFTEEWFEEHLAPFLEDGADFPFFFAWQPGEKPFETGFAWLTEEPDPQFQVAGYVSIDLPMGGILS